MSNISVVMRNELSNLFRSKLILITGVIYLLLFAKCLLDLYPPGDQAYSQVLSYYNMLGGKDSDYYTAILLNNLGYVITFYGSFLGIILGISTVAIERYSNTLSNLVVKPIYRDTIINGKLMGCSLFILLIFTLSIIAYTVYAMIAWGDAFSSIAGDYFIRLPVISFVSLLYVLFFFTISMLISLLIADLAFALILSMLLKFFMVDVLSGEISGKLSALLGWDFVNPPFREIIPDGIMSSIFKNPFQSNNLLNPSSDLASALSAALPDIGKLMVYVVIFLVAGYIVFVRRDVA